MKRIFLFLGIALMSAGLSAQQIYNGSFEQWSSPLQPDGWGTWAAAVSQFNGIVGDSLGKLAHKDSLDHANYPLDSASVRMTVDTITLPSQGQVTLAGFISYGGAFYSTLPDTPVGLRFGYYPYIKKPDSLMFDYKYIAAAGFNDSALVVMTMVRFDSASQTEVYYLNQSWLIDTTSAWTHVKLPLNYLVSDTFHPDSIQIIIISSVARHLHRGTTLWVDTMHFDASVNIIDTPLGIGNIKDVKGVNAYPNPASKQLHILVQASEVGSGIQLYDEEGRKVYAATIDRADYKIDTGQLPEGIYVLHMCSPDHLTIYTGRVTIVHND